MQNLQSGRRSDINVGVKTIELAKFEKPLPYKLNKINTDVMSHILKLPNNNINSQNLDICS